MVTAGTQTSQRTHAQDQGREGERGDALFSSLSESTSWLSSRFVLRRCSTRRRTGPETTGVAPGAEVADGTRLPNEGMPVGAAANGCDSETGVPADERSAGEWSRRC